MKDKSIYSATLQAELNKLNPEQKLAVFHEGGTALVLAGAGSGKTKVLTTRVAWLIESGAAQADEILLVTFTNKAAHEMKKRVKDLTGLELNLAGTFHALCAKILRRHAPAVHLNYNFTIYDADDQLTLLKNIYKENAWDVKHYKPAVILGVIGQAKNALQTPEDYEMRAQGDFGHFVATAYRIYQKKLRADNAVDFDDLLNLTVQLFETNKEILTIYQQKFKYVLVDEYQDTNKAQYLLTKFLAQPQNNLMVVGDFSQSIYAWRGADYRNMKSLEKDFHNLTKYYLEQNYRSVASILAVANDVIQHNSDHPILKLWTEKTEQETVKLTEMQTTYQEADEVIKTARSLHENEGQSYADMTILYRVNAQSRPFEESLTKMGIPYKLVGGFKFYERKEVKDILAYLRLAINPGETVALGRATKLGKRRLAKFWEWREKWPAEKLAETEPYELLKEILEATSYRDFFDIHDEEDVARLENIEELLQASHGFMTASSFLENVALVQDNEMADKNINEDQKERDEITLMSFHAAKGLEFETVFMVGMEEGLLPHARSLTDRDEMAEERRLCYVGMTRAKKRLYLSYACQRWQWGTVMPTQKSRFLGEIDPKWLEVRTLEEPEWEGFRKRKNGNGKRRGKWERVRNGEEMGNWDSNENITIINLDSTGENSVQKKQTGKRVFIPDEDLNDVLSDEIDIKTFLRN